MKPPKITSQPNDVLDVVPGEQAVMKVFASGYYIKYQWKRNGRAIQGETSSSYCIENTKMENEGEYQCHVSNGTGNVLTKIAKLSVCK